MGGCERQVAGAPRGDCRGLGGHWLCLPGWLLAAEDRVVLTRPGKTRAGEEHAALGASESTAVFALYALYVENVLLGRCKVLNGIAEEPQMRRPRTAHSNSGLTLQTK